jgi:hypothetical protein
MLENEYETKEAIPSGWDHLYRDLGGKYVLKQAGDVKSPTDVSNVQEALRKERSDHDIVKTNLAKFGSLDPVTTRTELDKINEYKAAAAGKLDDAAIDAIVETRITSRIAPVQRELDTTKIALETSTASLASMETVASKRTIEDLVRTAGVKSKLTDTGMADALFMAPHVFTKDPITNGFITKENVGVTPGIGADVWLTEMQSTRPGWWPESQSGGATGGNGKNHSNNPFSYENWNLTEQGKVLTESRDKANQMAKSAGTTVGGKRPLKK